MTRTKKIYGFRLGDRVDSWVDRYGKKGGRIIKLIRLSYCEKFQIQVWNGDILTTEFFTQEEFMIRFLNN